MNSYILVIKEPLISPVYVGLGILLYIFKIIC